jgi:acyl transferase domain-containing protein/phosphopantetheinyl transferase/acyl carrier protein
VNSEDVAEPSKVDIAIIGMACLFPGAASSRAYWANIVGGVDAIGDPPPGWAVDAFDPASGEPDPIACRRGGFLGEVSGFDPLSYGVMPNAVDGAEPEHFLALRVAHEALADAGYLDRPFDRKRAGVILGRLNFLNRGNVTALQHGMVIEQTLRVLRDLHPEYGEDDLRQLRRQLKDSLPPFNAETMAGLVSNVMCGRIANRLDLQGPNYAVDAACASSPIALDLGVRELESGRCDLMLVGGVSVATSPIVLMAFTNLGAVSQRGRIRPFDVGADGTLLGEGIGMVVLKRRAEAERDGDRIYAVIRGIGIASDGRGLGLLAPRLEGEELSIRRAYEAAAISPDTVGLVEAHGTGTVVGDATEIQALQRVFGPRHGPYARCAIGSVKSMIGHSIPAAGIAGLIKTALALHHRTLPPTLGCETPNPKFELERTPFYVNTATRPWIHGGREPRRAGVSSFGFGGINAHVILEEHPARAAMDVDPSVPRECEVVVVQGASRSDLVQVVDALREELATARTPLIELARARNGELRERTLRLAVVAWSPEDLDRKLVHARSRLAREDCARIKDVSGIYFFREPLARAGKVAFLFPGEGAQYPNMLGDLCLAFPQVGDAFDQADRVFHENGRSYVPSQVVFPPPLDSHLQGPALWDLECAVASVFAANRGLAALLGRLAIEPDVVAGHSSGEYSALLQSRAITFESEDELLQNIRVLNELCASAERRVPPATLVTAGAVRPGLLEETLSAHPTLRLAIDNCPHQVVLCGPEAAAQAAMGLLRQRGAICSVLPFGRAYHTPEFGPVADEVERCYDRLRIVAPRIPVYSCMTAAPFPSDPREIRRLAVGQWTSPVRFRETIEAMHAGGVRVFVEVGSRGMLTGFVEDTLRGKAFAAVPVNVTQRSGVAQLMHALAQLAAHGVSMDLGPLYADGGSRHSVPAAGARAPSSRTAMPRLPLELPVLNLADPGAIRASHHSARPAEGAGGRSMHFVAAPADGTPAGTPPLPHPGPRTDGGAAATEGPAVPVGLGDVGGPSRAMNEYLRTMEQFLELQESVLSAFLQRTSPESAASRPDGPSVAEVVARAAPPARAPEPAANPADETRSDTSPAATRIPEGPAAARLEPAPTAPLGRDAVVARLLGLVSEKTGYPVEMLDPSLNMEADLGIDSIKRVEILGAFQRQTGLLRPDEMEAATSLKTLEQVIEFFAARTAGPAEDDARPPHPPPPTAGAFVRDLVSLEPGVGLVARVGFDARRDRFLLHHTIGGQVSTLDDDRPAMSVVPLAISLEIMAEAAARLRPGRTLVGMRAVRAYRWLPLEDDRREVTVVARVDPGMADAVSVRILDAADGGGERADGPAVIEGTMVFGDAYPVAPRAMPLTLSEERPYRFGPGEYYSEVMFHGPLFQSVTSIDRCGAEGAEARVSSGEQTGFFRALPKASFAIDPVLVDAAGQLVGFWTADRLDRKFVIFPVGFRALELYQPILAASEPLTCRMRQPTLRDDRVSSDIEFADSAGRLVARFDGWEDMRFDFAREIVRFMLSPRDRMVSQPWPEVAERFGPGGTVGSSRVLLDQLPRVFFDPAQMWHAAWTRLVLLPSERDEWLRVPERRRANWLAGRLAAKDAVRRLLVARHGLEVCAGDVEIATDEHGAPVARGRWTERIGGPPAVSLTHANGVAAAVAVAGSSGARVGVDLEVLRDFSEELLATAFTPDERELFASLGSHAAREWSVRLWCAKEALGKALGRGLIGGPQAVVVERLDPVTGQVEMSVTGTLARLVDRGSTRTFQADTIRDGDLIMACARVADRPT